MKDETGGATDYRQFRLATIFTGLNYCLGCFFVALPRLYLDWKRRITDVRSDLCLGSDKLKDELATFCIMAIAVITLLFLIAFKMMQGKGKSDYIWYYVKFWYWVCNPVFTGALVIY